MYCYNRDAIDQMGRSMSKLSLLFSCCVLLGALPLRAQETPGEGAVVSSENCSFIASPDDVLNREARARRSAYERTLRFSSLAAKGTRAAEVVEPSSVPRKNLIDDEIFGALERNGIRSAPLASDEVFLRRVSFDLTGQSPSPEQIRAFVDDPSPEKRDRVIDQLLSSPGFVDKWSMWLGDLLQNARFAANRSQQTEGRNRLHEYITNAIANNKSFRDIAYEMVTANGNNFNRETPGANFIIRGFHPMGPAQDTYDLLFLKTATTFLGMGHYDCILCHDGRGHLNSVSVWGAKAKRVEAQRMAAHFSRVVMQRYPSNDRSAYYYNSFTVQENGSRGYLLNTTSGNRPRRDPVTEDGRDVNLLTPVYRDGRAAEGSWRDAFVRGMIEDPMFSRNFANRIWKAMFNLAIAEPVDFLDPERLTPGTELPEGWSMQASNPELLEKLSNWVRDNDFNLREYLRLIASSSAYQLSSRYEGEWKFEYTPLFARHYPRRLEAEEVHDAVLRATGTSASYMPSGYTEPVRWAMQLPEPTEPRSNGLANAFLNSFNRGNRDTLQRSQDGSILLHLNLMNSPVVNDRVLSRNSPAVRAWVARQDDAQIVEEMFLAFLSRKPSEEEASVAMKAIGGASGNERTSAIEDLAWALVNKVDFLFSY